ncbi:MAG: hypothetical protein B7Y12_10990 [Rhizobiales bacterium 24-66-13]|jgi:hypothetical protein|nr:MAG: hypothetical protein B7Y12_10990 [Rhizobiales bacterium 24-66-13]OZB06640.1 MAG: hypothetical protein B7X67_10075 [Rhizobiales bacterium 39-66-18]HQS48857.1 DUF1403 family protein [Xanthobacteraceae bacterium]
MRALDSTPTTSFHSPAVPGWAVPRAPVDDPVEAAYLAGAALNSLDNLVRSDPPWSGAWRQRLALKAAANAARLLGHREDEAALRDAWHLRPAGADPGPAGNVLAAWRRLATRSPAIEVESLRAIVGLLGLAWSDGFGAIPELVAEQARSTRPAPLVAAAVAGEVAAACPRAEALAWWCADLALAARFRWPFAVPLLATQIHAPLLRSGPGRRRLRLGEEGFVGAVCVAAAAGGAEACRLAGEIAARGRRLEVATPKLRTKGAGEAIRRLLDDDAVSGSLTTPVLSRWAARRLFERLHALEAVRELSGRPSFRLYGL